MTSTTIPRVHKSVGSLSEELNSFEIWIEMKISCLVRSFIFSVVSVYRCCSLSLVTVVTLMRIAYSVVPSISEITEWEKAARCKIENFENEHLKWAMRKLRWKAYKFTACTLICRDPKFNRLWSLEG